MTKNERLVWVAGIPAVLVGLSLISWFKWDIGQKFGPTIMCADGPHGKIDLRNFVTQYSQWSITFEAEAQGKGKIGTKLEPREAQQLSEAIQQANEFRKFVVAGYNACAISNEQYGRFGSALQTLDSLERQIGQLISKTGSTQEDGDQLQKLVAQVIDVSQKLVNK
jgi:hypothetical protein